MVERFYADVDGRQMHYRRAGRGIPLILLHESPRSSAAMEPWIRALAEHVTVLAPDTAGYGQSDPLPEDEPEIDAYARSVIAFADALGLERFIVAGTHTGSKIALSTAVQAPDRVAQLVMDGLGVYTETEAAEHLEHYTVPIVPVWHGGHLLAAWHRMRSMWTFWPWYRMEADRRLATSIPDLQTLHQMVYDQLRATPEWGLAYRAAFRYNAHAALEELRTPAVLLAKETDPLRPHLERLGTRNSSLRVAGVTDDDHVQEIVAAIDLSLDIADPPPPPAVTHRGGTSRRYVPTSQGNVHVRMDGDPANPPVVVLHPSPGSGDTCQDLILDLARDHFVIAPDMPGNGHSDPPGAQQPDIAFYAAPLAEALTALGIERPVLYGSHTGACLAVELAAARPDLPGGVVADGIPDLTEDERADILTNYMLPLTPERNGEHLIRAWHMLRDMQLYWPWYRDEAEHARDTAPSAPERLHHLFLQMLKSGETYELAYRAAFRYDAAPRLGQTTAPTVICADPSDMLHRSSQGLAAAAGANVAFTELRPEDGRDAAWAVRTHAAHHAGPPDETRPKGEA